MKGWLEEAGFVNVKIWEQPINFLFRDGEEFVAKFAEGRIKREAQTRGMSPEKVQ